MALPFSPPSHSSPSPPTMATSTPNLKKQLSKADRKNETKKLACRKVRKKGKGCVAVADKVEQLGYEGDDCSNEPKSVDGTHAKKSTESETQSGNGDLSRPKEASDIIRKKLKKKGKGVKKDHLVSKEEGKFVNGKNEGEVEEVYHITSVDEDCCKGMKKKLKKKGKGVKKDHLVSKEEGKFLNGKNDVEVEEIYHITSVDEDCSKGMKKWLLEYHQSRPGLKVLQQRIDDFMVAHDAHEEQARKERESRAAEGGWTVVVHHKGRKKTTDSESGIAVGSVAEAAVVEKMANKKSKEVPLNFYRFQRREAQRNEVMMLQSKFKQDKKRIQQLRAARKFRPY